MNSKWPKVMLLSAVTSLWLLCDITAATEAPLRMFALLKYSPVACGLVALLGSAVRVRYATER